MYKKFNFIIIILLIIIFSPNANAYDADTSIRVGISDSGFSTYIFDSASFYSEQEAEVTDIATGEVLKIPKGSEIKVTMTDGVFSVKSDYKFLNECRGPIVIRTVEVPGLIFAKGVKRAGKPAAYRGIIELVKSYNKSNGFAVVNVLDLKNYLRGVVPNEMPVSFGLEALKAQTVAARNYALRPREKFYKEFDICDSVACQVYFGAKTERALSDKAINETDGLVALYDGKLILALYSSTAGGYTESHANAFSELGTRFFPGKDIPYLRSKSDIPDGKPLNSEKDARAFYNSRPDTYDNSSPYFRWTRTWEKDEFTEMLNKTMQEQAGFIKPKFTADDRFDTLREVRIIQRGDSGKVMFIEIITNKGVYTVGKELTLRRLFKKDGKALPSANFVCDIINDEDTGKVSIKFTGGGFGHGVGMSQYGAGKMSEAGLSFLSILQHYYTGISIGTIPVTLNASYNRNAAAQSFYAPEGKAWICIDENKGISNITFVVNGTEAETSIGHFFKKKSRIDISKYLKPGMNTIEYITENNESPEKSITVRTEIRGSDE